MHRCFVIGVLVFASLPVKDSLGQSWTIQTVDSAIDAGAYNSMALDSRGYAHISYDAWHEGIKYARWTGSAWLIERVDSTGWLFPSVALDNSDYPHIGYGARCLKYARWTGSEWAIEEVDTSVFHPHFSCIALDSAYCPHISYKDIGRGKLKYARWTGSEWAIQDVDTTGSVGRSSFIALDANGCAHISYSGEGTLKYARWTGSEWAIEEVDSTAAAPTYCSIVLDSTDYPHMAYLSGTTLNYARWTGSEWAIENVDTAEWGGDVDRRMSIALDDSDHPHISYGKVSVGLKYAYWTGSEWNIETVDTTGGGEGETSLALDSNGCPHICYPGNVLKYAYRTAGVKEGSAKPDGFESLDLSCSSNPSHRSVTLSYELSSSSNASLTIYDGSGRIVRSLSEEYRSAGNHSIEWNGKDDRGQEVESGAYFCELKVKDSNRSVKKLITLR